MRKDRASGLACDGDTSGVAAEGCNIVDGPSDGELEVLDVQVLFADGFAVAVGEEIEAVVWVDEDDWFARRYGLRG
jgi:hypothetical protein